MLPRLALSHWPRLGFGQALIFEKALKSEGWNGLQVKPEDLPKDPEYVAYRLNFMMTSLGARAVLPKRLQPMKRPWLSNFLKGDIRHNVNLWAGGAFSRGRLESEWPDYVRLVQYSPSTRAEYEMERKLHPTEKRPRRPPQPPEEWVHPLNRVMGDVVR